MDKEKFDKKIRSNIKSLPKWTWFSIQDIFSWQNIRRIIYLFIVPAIIFLIWAFVSPILFPPIWYAIILTVITFVLAFPIMLNFYHKDKYVARHKIIFDNLQHHVANWRKLQYTKHVQEHLNLTKEERKLFLKQIKKRKPWWYYISYILLVGYVYTAAYARAFLKGYGIAIIVIFLVVAALAPDLVAYKVSLWALAQQKTDSLSSVFGRSTMIDALPNKYAINAIHDTALLPDLEANVLNTFVRTNWLVYNARKHMVWTYVLANKNLAMVSVSNIDWGNNDFILWENTVYGSQRPRVLSALEYKHVNNLRSVWEQVLGFTLTNVGYKKAVILER